MKKILLLLFAALLPLGAFAKEGKAEYDNPGYYATRGLIGAYGLMPSYTAKHFSNNTIGGGVFAYYNVFNRIWGNVAVGISADYTSVKYGTSSSPYYDIKGNLIPVGLNVAYMTASDFLNFWGGAALTYTFADMDIKGGYTADYDGSNARYFDSPGKKSAGLIGGDLFVGAEYIFTENKKFGVFFEFRYSFTQSVKIDEYIAPMDYTLNDKINLNRYRYTLGVIFHF